MYPYLFEQGSLVNLCYFVLFLVLSEDAILSAMERGNGHSCCPAHKHNTCSDLVSMQSSIIK